MGVLDRAVTQALASVHHTGGLVGDLRLETVFVEPEGRNIHFLGMGIAAMPQALRASEELSGLHLAASAVRGTSPEQVAGECLDFRSNLFSLGSLLYEMVTGIAPFRGSTPLETASRVLSLEVQPVIEVREGVPQAFDTLVRRLLHKDPSMRPPSAQTVAVALGSIETQAANPLRALARQDELEAEIDSFYQRIDDLLQAKKAGRGEEVDTEIATAYGHLRKLQKIEAARFRDEFEGRLAMPVDAGETLLARARSLREKIGRLTAPDPSRH